MRENCQQLPSPNFRKSTNKRKVKLIVIHATRTTKSASPLHWLTLKSSQKSAHYLIDLDGTVYQLVDENNVAWHAGNSRWKGMEEINPRTQNPSVNNCSIGIELVNANDGIMPYPEPQVESLRALVGAICRERGISSENIVRHLDVSPGRKTDPANFPFDDFKGRLYKDGIS